MTFQIAGIIAIHRKTSPEHATSDLSHMQVSVDGVNETKSTSTSLEILSLRFSTCKNIYISVISRPQVHNKVAQKPTFECYLHSFIEEANELGITITLAVLDAPERATCRKVKQHGGYHSCDTCYANPVNYQTPGRSGCEYRK